MPVDIAQLLQQIDGAKSVMAYGRVTAVTGLAISATLPGAQLGDLGVIERQDGSTLECEVVGFSGEQTVVMPLGSALGIGPGDLVRSCGAPLSVVCSDALMGRVLDGLGRPIDGGPALTGVPRSIYRDPPNPMDRPRLTEALETGVKAIDGLLTIAAGQRVGVFAGSGVGKTSLMGQLACQTNADIFVACLIGERGRELREFLDDSLGAEGLARGVVICGTSDTPALVRMKSAYVATSIAEYFRDQGKRVLLMVDSVTRFARAAREVGLASGEAPARRGYPPSVFALLPGLLERSGAAQVGSITALYTVLVEGGDMEEPIADEVRGILDGHIVLERRLAEQNHYPAIDVLQSLSRVMNNVTNQEHQQSAGAFRSLLAAYESRRDLISIGAYKSGADAKVDRAIKEHPAMERFLRQRSDERVSLETALLALRSFS